MQAPWLTKLEFLMFLNLSVDWYNIGSNLLIHLCEALLILDNSDDVPPKWMTESDKSALLRAGIKFMDITDHPNTPITSFAVETPGMFI